MTRSRLRTAALNLALVGVSLIVALGFAEVLLRVLRIAPPLRYHLNPPHATLRDVQMSWDVTYETNALGLRWDEIDEAKPAGTTRLALVGDSFTFGMGCERKDTFPDRLRDALRAQGRPVEVMNISNFGIGPVSYAELVERLALPLGADIVVVTVYGNDASDRVSESVDRAFVRALGSHSHVVTLLRTLRRRVRVQAGHAIEEIQVDSGAVLPNDPGGVRARALAEFRRAHGLVFNNLVAGLALDPEEVSRTLNTPDDSPGRKDFEREIGRIDDLCKKHGVQLVLGIVPDSAAVDPRQGELRKAFGLVDPADMLTAPSKFELFVRAFAAGRGIPCFDPIGRFREVRDGLYYEADMHWTPAGNALYASELLRFLDPWLPVAKP